MSMFNDISCDTNDNKDECLKSRICEDICSKDLELVNGHLLDQVLKRNGILQRIIHKELRDNIAEEMLLEFAESGHPTFHATTPLSRSILRSKGYGKLSMHFSADCPTIETVFRIIISVNQLSIYGAVAAICEELENAKMDRENLSF